MLLIFILFGLVCLLGVCFIIAMLYTFDMLEEINDLRKQKDIYKELYDNAKDEESIKLVLNLFKKISEVNYVRYKR